MGSLAGACEPSSKLRTRTFGTNVSAGTGGGGEPARLELAAGTVHASNTATPASVLAVMPSDINPPPVRGVRVVSEECVLTRAHSDLPCYALLTAHVNPDSGAEPPRADTASAEDPTQAYRSDYAGKKHPSQAGVGAVERQPPYEYTAGIQSRAAPARVACRDQEPDPRGRCGNDAGMIWRHQRWDRIAGTTGSVTSPYEGPRLGDGCTCLCGAWRRANRAALLLVDQTSTLIGAPGFGRCCHPVGVMTDPKGAATVGRAMGRHLWSAPSGA